MKLGRVEVCYIAPVNRRKKRLKINYQKVLVTVSTLVGIALTNLTVYAQEVTIPTVEDVKKKINDGGESVLGIGQTVGFWVAVLMAGFEIIKCIKDGDVNRVWGILVKYGMALTSLYLIEWIFKAIEGWFA